MIESKKRLLELTEKHLIKINELRNVQNHYPAPNFFPKTRS